MMPARQVNFPARMRQMTASWLIALIMATSLVHGIASLTAGDAVAQTAAKPGKKKVPAPKSEVPSAIQAVDPQALPLPEKKPSPGTDAADTQQPAKTEPATERVEADVSTRTIAVTSGYSGAEVIVFGAIENSRQPSAESGFYDVVVVVEGEPAPLTVRQKSRVAGLWVNTKSFSFNAVPSYYAVVSTRPIEEFADAPTTDELGIGIDAVRMAAAADSAVRVTSDELLQFKSAVARLKESQGLFKQDDYGVVFTGRSLFRSKIELPATVPVGPLTASVYLFHEGELLSRYQARVTLEREGIERWLYAFAFDRPVLYGIMAVFLAVATGLVASALFHRRNA
jgi:uncharacterized protein (TIGR02186 family)